MALLDGKVSRDYAPRAPMPQPAFGKGPWGEAVKYWLSQRNMRQSELARATKLTKNTVSSVTRGFHTNTRVLERIAIALKVDLDAVLVSPVRRLANEDQRRMIAQAVEFAMRTLNAPPTIDAGALALAEQITKMPSEARAMMANVLEEYEHGSVDRPKPKARKRQ